MTTPDGNASTDKDKDSLSSDSANTLNWREFLEDTPPGVWSTISDPFRKARIGNGLALALPIIRLHCSSPACEGVPTWFNPPGDIYVGQREQHEFITYICRNCGKSTKTFAVRSARTETDEFCSAFKLGEEPAFGPPIPTRVLRLVENDRSLMLKGRRCENQGLGVAAFAYYRRVVENSKDRLLSEIARVAKATGAAPELLSQIEAAQRSQQFSSAVEQVKAALPPSLLINGHNPLTLLHSALSEGVHSLSDEECLELATDIRVVLTEFIQRAAEAVREDAELKAAIHRLTRQR